MVGRKGKRTNNRTTLPGVKNNAVSDYQGALKGFHTKTHTRFEVARGDSKRLKGFKLVSPA